MLTSQRHLFSIPEDIHYLNCAYMSPLLKSVESAGISGLLKKSQPYQITPTDFFALPRQTQVLFASLINAPNPDHVSFIPSVSYGMSVVAKNIQMANSANIVCVGEEFPSNVYAWKPFTDNGVQLKIVRSPIQPSVKVGGRTRAELWNEAILEAINNNTSLVVVCPIHWTDGTIFDLERIGSRAKDVGAAFVIDATQAVGAYHLDVFTIKPDALIAAGYKSMMGGYSLGCAYWGERFNDATPIEETWMGRKGSDDFRNLINYQQEYESGMARLNVGETANFILMPMLHAALTQLLDWVPANVQLYCRELITPLVEYCESNEIWLEQADRRASHLFGLVFRRERFMEKIQSACLVKKVFVSFRGDNMRVSPNVYNTTNDIECLIEAISETLQK